MNEKKKYSKPRQMVCFEILNFKPTSEQPVETVKFIFHGPYKNGNPESHEFRMPFIVASKEFVIGSEELLFFLSDWSGTKINDSNLTYGVIRSRIIGKRRALNALLKIITIENSTQILNISPYRGKKELWPIIGLKAPNHLCNRVSFEYEDIGLLKLSSTSLTPQENVKPVSTPVISVLEKPAIGSFTPIIIPENEILRNENSMEIYLKIWGINVTSDENKKLMKEIASSYYEFEIDELQFARRNGFNFSNLFDVRDFLDLKRRKR